MPVSAACPANALETSDKAIGTELMVPASPA
jgi:hypothetical protein